jgi:hypothetical protein
VGVALIAIIVGLTMLAAGFVFMGVQWWRQGVPVSDGRKLTGGAAKALGVSVILLGLALGLFGWIWLPGLMR